MADSRTIDDGKTNASRATVWQVLLAVLFLLPGIAAGLLIAMMTVYWTISGFTLAVEDRNNTILFSMAALAIVLISSVMTGIVLRYMRTSRAGPFIRALAVAVLIQVLAVSSMLSTTFEPTEFSSWIALLMFAAIALAIGALPPLLHAQRAGR